MVSLLVRTSFSIPSPVSWISIAFFRAECNIVNFTTNRPLPPGPADVTMPLMTTRRALTLLTALTLLAFGLRALSLDAQSMWRDEIDTLCFALDFWERLEGAMGHDERGQDPPWSSPERLRCQPTPGVSRVDNAQGLRSTLRALLTLPGWNGPLYTVAMRPWIGLSGESPFALRYSSLLFGLLAVPLTYVVGRRLLGTAVGLVGATLVALSPHLVWYSQEAKMYAAILALGLLAIYGLRRALDQNQTSEVFRDFGSLKWWGATVGATTLALYCHVLAALLIPLQMALGLIWWPRTRRHWRGALVALGLLTLPYLPLVVWQVRTWLLPAGKATLFTVGRLDLMLDAAFGGWAGSFVGEPWATLVLGGLTVLALFGVVGSGLSEGGIETGDRDLLHLGGSQGAERGSVGEPRPTPGERRVADPPGARESRTEKGSIGDLRPTPGERRVADPPGARESRTEKGSVGDPRPTPGERRVADPPGARESRTEKGSVGEPRPTLGWREPLALLVWMGLPLLGIWLISARQPIFTNRYVIWSAPAFYLLAAAGFVGLVRLGRGGGLVAAGLLLLVLAGDGRALADQATRSLKPDFRAAAAYVERHYRPGDLVVFHLSYMAQNFDYYFPGEYEGWGAPAPGGGMSESELDFLMRTNTSGHERVWLVMSEAEMWDPQGLVKAWMDDQALVPPEAQVFAHVSVYGYEVRSRE
jgi:hypothetical protein